jgi:aryl-alcohol dehydrogenase-like predicted oxidoreductase
MKYGFFGKSGLRVSEICLGTMTFGEDWGWGGSKNESLMFNTFVDAGGKFLDTANNYTQGTSEKYLGEFIEETGIDLFWQQSILPTQEEMIQMQGGIIERT